MGDYYERIRGLAEASTRNIETNSYLLIDSIDRNSNESINNFSIKNTIRESNAIALGLAFASLPLNIDNINPYNNSIVLDYNSQSYPVTFPVGNFYPDITSDGVKGIPNIIVDNFNSTVSSSDFHAILDGDGRVIIYNSGPSDFGLTTVSQQTQQVTGLYQGAVAASITSLYGVTYTKAIKLYPILGLYTRYIDIVSTSLTRFNSIAASSKNFPPNLIARIFVDRTKAMVSYSDRNFPSADSVVTYEFRNINWMRYIPSSEFGVGVDIKLYDEFSQLLYIGDGTPNISLNFYTKNI